MTELIRKLDARLEEIKADIRHQAEIIKGAVRDAWAKARRER